MGSFSDHHKKAELVLQRPQKSGLKVNVTKSFFARSQLEYLGYWITRTGIKLVYDKVKAVLKIAEPKNQKEFWSFFGVVNYYRDMLIRRSHVLAPLAALTSITTKWKWQTQHQKAFAMTKRINAKETLLAYPDFNKPFLMYTDASDPLPVRSGGFTRWKANCLLLINSKISVIRVNYSQR